MRVVKPHCVVCRDDLLFEIEWEAWANATAHPRARVGAAGPVRFQ